LEFIGIIEFILYTITGIISWFIKLLWDGNKDNKREIEMLKLKLAEEYIKKDEIRDAITAFKQELRETINPLCDKITKIDDWLRSNTERRGQ
jgi:hypothetical protein